MITKKTVMSLGLLKLTLYFLIAAWLPSISQGAVILQYHHVSESTPRITSATVEEFTSHLNWLDMNGFEVIPLNQLVEQIKSKQLNPSAQLAVITFDDTGSSVCETAWPILKERQLPFTVFINTAIMLTPNPSQCSWEALKAMQGSGLMTVANHSHNHLHMINYKDYDSKRQWAATMKEEITAAQTVLKDKLNVTTGLFAYPYGEYNQDLQKIVAELGYVALGQQSGAIGPESDLTALPRFPLSGIYASLKTFGDKMLSLPFPIQELELTDNPIYPKSRFSFFKLKPPELTLTLKPGAENIAAKIQCYSGGGKKIPTSVEGTIIQAQGDQELEPGRNRYNCTTPSSQPGRFYWFSNQWLYLAPGYTE